MRLPLYQIDAFADRLFAGNPAAVCPLPRWIDERKMQAIAAENNLAETAFFVRRGSLYELRWFTPTVEADLCGHATLASAYVIFTHLAPELREVSFKTRRAGVLKVSRRAKLLELDFPAEAPTKLRSVPPKLLGALGRKPEVVLRSARDDIAVFAREADVAQLTPDITALRSLDRPGLIVTAPGEKADFVARFFAPALGISEDPVTGSAYTKLVPYWAERLGKKRFVAHQLSARGGTLVLTLADDRVLMAGSCVPYLIGEISV